MSDGRKKRSHPIRLAISMWLGLFFAGQFLPPLSQDHPANLWIAITLLALGAFAGLAVELLRRLPDRPDQAEPPMSRISSVMSLTTSAGASLGFCGSVAWLAIRLAMNGIPKDFFGEGLGWAMLFVWFVTALGGGIGIGIGLLYATYKLWMNEA